MRCCNALNSFKSNDSKSNRSNNGHANSQCWCVFIEKHESSETKVTKLVFGIVVNFYAIFRNIDIIFENFGMNILLRRVNFGSNHHRILLKFSVVI